MRTLAIATLALLLFQGAAFAKVESLEGASQGEHYYGPQRTLESMKGHIVIWENWGYK